MTRTFYEISAAEQAEHLTSLARKALMEWDGQFRDLTLIKHRENAVFSARRDDGARVALRIHRHGYHSDAALRSELTWITALGEAGLDTPAVLPSRAGELMIYVEDHGVPERRQVDVLGWAAGRPLAGQIDDSTLDAETAGLIYHRVGQTAARLHLQADAWTRPEGFVRHHWDLPALIGESPFWGRFWEYEGLTVAQRSLIDRTRARAAIDLAAFAASGGDYGLIHADMIPDNLLLDGERVSLIDFDDAGFGWRTFELATILHFLADNPHSAVMEAALLEGYQSVRPLLATDLDALPMFLALRGLSYIGWIHTRRETETAHELAPALIDLCCRRAEAYLSRV